MADIVEETVSDVKAPNDEVTRDNLLDDGWESLGLRNAYEVYRKGPYFIIQDGEQFYCKAQSGILPGDKQFFVMDDVDTYYLDKANATYAKTFQSMEYAKSVVELFKK